MDKLWSARIACTNCKKEISFTDKEVKHRLFELPDASRVHAYVECPHCGIHHILPSLFYLHSTGRATFHPLHRARIMPSS